jgi:hypothetical protein
MKVILEFEEDDREGALLAQHAADWYSVVTDMDEWLRGEIKYQGRGELQPIRDKLCQLVLDAGLTLYP